MISLDQEIWERVANARLHTKAVHDSYVAMVKMARPVRIEMPSGTVTYTVTQTNAMKACLDLMSAWNRIASAIARFDDDELRDALQAYEMAWLTSPLVPPSPVVSR